MGLKLTELVPCGGEWGGVLFENAPTGVPLRLTWWFRIDYETITRSYGETTPNLQVEWVNLPVPTWRSLEGIEVRDESFGESIESSVYYFEHHRFDAVRLRVKGQSTTKIDVSIEVRGDIDRLGIDPLQTQDVLEFRGITVPAERLTPYEAVAKLSAFTDTTGLRQTDEDGRFHFYPMSRPQPGSD